MFVWQDDSQSCSLPCRAEGLMGQHAAQEDPGATHKMSTPPHHFAMNGCRPGHTPLLFTPVRTRTGSMSCSRSCLPHSVLSSGTAPARLLDRLWSLPLRVAPFHCLVCAAFCCSDQITLCTALLFAAFSRPSSLHPPVLLPSKIVRGSSGLACCLHAPCAAPS